jgi:hypothetical protein
MRLFLLGALLFASCGPEPPLEPTYENVRLIVARSCTFETSCHGGTGRGEANMNLSAARDPMGDITPIWVGVPSCEYDLMPRVDPGNPDNSWILIKLDSVYDADLNVIFTPDPAWMPMSTRVCPGDGDFGARMPDTGPPLPMREITMLREWIALGAPGPI